MFLFIFESIGTSELLLIGVIALVVFGPRKLPQMARTLGKTMADFRRTTNDFKSTWEKEVNFAEEEERVRQENHLLQNQISAGVAPDQSGATPMPSVTAPEIKEVDDAKIREMFPPNNGVQISGGGEPQIKETSKRDWL